MTALPDWLPLPEWEGYVAMRKTMKKVMTPRAVTLRLAELEQMRSEGQDIGAVLDQSTANNWIGVFPVKPQDRRQASRSTGPDMSRLGKAGQATANNAMDWLEGN